MRIKKGFKLRKICDADVVIAMGVEHVDYSKIVSLNESAAWLWRQVENCEFDAAMLSSLLQDNYKIDADKAAADVDALLEKWQELHFLE